MFLSCMVLEWVLSSWLLSMGLSKRSNSKMGISLSLLQTWDLQYTVGNYFYLLLFIYFSVFTINYQYKRAHKCFFITLKTFYWDSKHVHIWVWKHCTEKICEAIKNYNRWRVVCFSKGANDAIPIFYQKPCFVTVNTI